MFFPVEEWFAAFLLTIAIEVPIVVLLLRRAEPQLPRLAAIALFANLASHPAVWFVFTQLFLVGTIEYRVAAESWAVLVETAFFVVVIRGIRVRLAFAAALIANVCSFVVGIAVGEAWLEFLT